MARKHRARKDAVIKAREYSASELGCITHFEHVNFRIPSHYDAILLFAEGLGFTRDPTRMVGVRNMWINAGIQQFHLPVGASQPFDGEVCVVVPDLDRTQANLEAISDRLRHTSYEFRRTRRDITLTTPWGQAIRVRSQAGAKSRLPQAIDEVRYKVAAGSAAGIARFYQTYFQAPAEVRPRGKLEQCTVNVGVNQYFTFVEQRRSPNLDHPNHVAIYVTHYDAIYEAMSRDRLIMAPSKDEQFRFATITDPKNGEVLYEFEHEVRSLHHPDYRKPLVNRVPVPYLVD